MRADSVPTVLSPWNRIGSGRLQPDAAVATEYAELGVVRLSEDFRKFISLIGDNTPGPNQGHQASPPSREVH